MALANQPTQSLLTDSARLSDTLREALGRLIKIGDQLHGQEPQPAQSGAVPPAPTPVPHVRLHIDTASSLAEQIHSALTRLEARL